MSTDASLPPRLNYAGYRKPVTNCQPMMWCFLCVGSGEAIDRVPTILVVPPRD